MDDSDRKGLGLGHKINKDNIRLADTLIQVLKDNAESPEAACAALMLAHAKLWVLYGENDWDGVASMMAEYVTDFFTLIKVLERPMPPENNNPLH